MAKKASKKTSKTKKEKKVKKDKKEKNNKKDKKSSKKIDKIVNSQESYSDTNTEKDDLEISEYNQNIEVNDSIVETKNCLDESEEKINKTRIIDPKDRITRNFLTKYEAVRIIGERTKQLIMGAKPLISNHQEFSYEELAVEELKLNMIPFKIRRPVGNNIEIWSLSELRKDHLQSILD